uniref:Uncharacterized protein n=1 Tax=Magallana gigas TaxID=29159 RepID=K1Q8K7_MAGGI
MEHSAIISAFLTIHNTNEDSVRDDGLYQLNCDYEVGDEYGAPDPPFFIHIGDTWRRCTCMVYGDRERSTLETFVYVCCVVVS